MKTEKNIESRIKAITEERDRQIRNMNRSVENKNIEEVISLARLISRDAGRIAELLWVLKSNATLG